MNTDDREKVLIIKPGYSETLDPEVSGIVSLGDILRTTVILHLFPRETHQVTWLVDGYGISMLRNNPLIERVLKLNSFTPFHLMREQFDVVINLEKDPGICSMADSIPAWRRYGFRFDAQRGNVSSYEHALEAMRIVTDPEFKCSQAKSWSELLFDMLGADYQGQPYVLGYAPKEKKPKYDIGLNYRAGKKFPLKLWPKANWEDLEKRLAGDFSVRWQPAVDDVENIESYFEWVASCRVLVTQDSLGLHLALGFGRKTVGLFGPTHPHEIFDVPELVKLAPAPGLECLGCSDSVCARGTPCINSITVDAVEAAVRGFLA